MIEAPQGTEAKNKIDPICYEDLFGVRLLLFPVARDTHECFCRLQSNALDAALLKRTT